MNELGIESNMELLKIQKVPTEPEEYNYFSPALMDCWPRIMSFITGSQDLQAVMDSCGVFYDLVESRVFTELVAPALLHKNGFLGKNGFLKCRQLNSTIKSAVDHTLRVTRYRDWSKKHFESSVEFEELLHKAVAMPNATPFMLRSIELYTEDDEDMRSAIELLKSQGQRLDSVNFSLPREYQAGPLMTMLNEALRHLPQLRILHFMFTLQFADRDEDRTMLEPIPPSGMPRLENLKELQMLSIPDEDEEDEEGEVGEVPPPAPLIQSILQAYGKQLTSFSSDNFIYTLGLGVDFFNTYLLNVEHCKIYGFDEIVDAEHGTLAQVTWPKLESLDLFSFEQTITTAALQVLGNFRTSLKKIHFGDVICNHLDIIQGAQNLPNVKQIVLSVSNIRKPIMLQGFPTLFPNLEYIKFLPSFANLNLPNPGLSVRNKYFDSYPKLKTFVWSHCTAYSQWMDNEFTRNSALPTSRVCFTQHCS
ncbi:hypothetical protein Ocin01_17199 [Orchesella cincta]|uniref:Uncharacterized protein n=1 Tax=Orchesella cincta TaxID=48709 RepID=A0A1D2M927_ORCCI|nr:hypothetical protein Ocin01_17199 [Orchesella cincta]